MSWSAVERPFMRGELRAILAEGREDMEREYCALCVLCSFARTKANTGQDIHPTLPLLASEGQDGLIKIWSLASLSPSSATPQILGPPLSSTPYLHAGHWPSQILWASPSSLHLLSKSAYVGADNGPRTVVRL